MSNTHRLAWALAAAIGFSVSAQAVLAADASTAAQATMPSSAIDGSFSAVSGVNGKVEVFGGTIDASSGGTNGALGLDGSLSVPLGHDFGFQGDALVSTSGGKATWGAGAHLFTRDPNAYLLGITGAAVRRDSTTIWGIGPEAALYLGRASIEAFAGYGGVDYPTASDKTGAFGFLDFAWYPTDDLRLALGGSSVLGANSLHLSGEYQFQDTGTSLSADIRTGEGNTSATLGINFYFGDHGSKTLIARHRQDDPGNAPQLFQTAGGNNWVEPDTTLPPSAYDTESACLNAGYYWNGANCTAI